MSLQTDETRDYGYIIDLVYERSRIRLHDGKRPLIRARLSKRMRLHGFATLSEYCQYLRSEANEAEIAHVVDALTTNFTHFLREKDHFDFTIRTALPTLLSKGQKNFTLWSAACASGEEAFSLAFYLAENFPMILGWNWKIVATDISTKVLAKAQQAVYAEERLESLPPEWVRRYFQKGHGKWEGHYRVKSFITERVQFQQLNLLGAYDLGGPFEVIYCRNVMIYFDRHTQEQLIQRLRKLLVPKGYLFVGHSESVTGISAGMRCLHPSIYQKE